MREGVRQKFANKEYRDHFVEAHIRTWIALQIRALREQRGWSQGELAEHLGKPQSVVSRLENKDYGRLSLGTLFEVAHALDVGLIVRFVDHDEWLKRTTDCSVEAMQAKPYGA